jgi:hypothetical protein
MYLRMFGSEDSEGVVGVYSSECHEEKEEGEWTRIHGCEVREGALVVDMDLNTMKSAMN